MSAVHPCPMPRCVDPIDGNPRLVTTPLCIGHRLRAAQLLDDAPALYVALAVALGDRGKSSGDKIARGKPVPPLPINVEVRALQEELVGLVLAAEDALRLDLDVLPRPPRGREGVVVELSSRWLVLRLDALLGQPYGVEAVVGLDKHTGRARRVLGLAKLVHRLPAPCPSCDLLTLRRDDGASVVRCVNDECRRTFAESDYRRLVTILAYEATA